MSRRFTKAEYKKYSAFDVVVNTLTIRYGKGYHEALDIGDEMTTRQLYKFLNDNGWAWSVAFEKWVTVPANK